MDLQLAGRAALVTGGTKGIGRATAECLADEGVDVAICSRTESDVIETVEAAIPMGRMANGPELAQPIVFLASPAASYITGTNIVVDGGLTHDLHI